jgi:RHS repeat-associated protein
MVAFPNRRFPLCSRHKSAARIAAPDPEAEAGLYYFRARSYCAELGAFVSRDPVASADADDTDLYPYPDVPPP